MKAYDFDFRFRNYFIKDIGVNLDSVKQRSVFEEKPTLRLVMTSRLSEYQKRQDLLIDAMAHLKNPNIHLTLIGDGDYETRLREQVDFHAISDFVSFKPFVPPDKLWKHLEQYDLLLHACDYEGLSKIILESMAHVLPVLASGVLPLNNYIQSGCNGFLVKNDAHAWAEKIDFLYKNQSLFPDVIKIARMSIEEKFDAHVNCADFEREYGNE